MRKMALLILSLTLVFILGACSQEQQQSDFDPVYLDVAVTINPEQGELNEPVTIDAKVTYGEENVEDADEVTFEIWRAQDEKHENIDVKHVGDGVYRLEKSFDREGTYYVITHVTAKDMHYMPREEFVVGQPSAPEEEPSSSTMNEDEQR